MVDLSPKTEKKVKEMRLGQFYKRWFFYLLFNPTKLRMWPSCHLLSEEGRPIIWTGKQAELTIEEGYYKNAKYLLIHEAVHILDRQHGLDYISLVNTSLLEGRATLMGWLYLNDFDLVYNNAVKWFGGFSKKNSVQKWFLQYKISADPYIPGLYFMASIAKELGVKKAFRITEEKPPASLEEILHPERYLQRALD